MTEFSLEQIASPAKRFLAALLDALLLGISMAIVLFTVEIIIQRFFYFNLNAKVFFNYSIKTLLIFIASSLYYTLTTYYMNGATPGKAMVGIRTISTETTHLHFMNVLYRHTVGSFLNKFFFAGYIMLLFDKRHRTIADMLCDTLVIEQPSFINNNYRSAPMFEENGKV